MALAGGIKDFGLPDIFQLIGLQRKTGTLTLKSKAESVTVTFEEGQVVNADTSAKRLEGRLGSLLVKQGHVSNERMEEALQKQKATLQKLGHVLVAGGYVKGDVLKKALAVQVSTTVFKLFRWTEGDYNFEAQDKVVWDRSHFDPMSADYILMEGIRMLDEWPIIEKKISSFDMTFRPVVDSSSMSVQEVSLDDELDGMGLMEEAKEEAPATKLSLSPEEERVYAKVDGKRTVQAIIDETGMADFDVCHTLYELLGRDIVALAGRSAVAKAAPTAKARGSASPVLGYALVAVALLMTVVGGLIQRTSPFGIMGLPAMVGGAFRGVGQDVTRQRLDRLDRSLAAVSLKDGAVPAGVDAAVQAHLVDRSGLAGADGGAFQFEAVGSGYSLKSADGKLAVTRARANP